MTRQATRPARAQHSDNPRYRVSLRIWHPRLSAAEVLRRMGMKADNAHTVGEPRVTARGRPLPGTFAETYCAFGLEHLPGLSPDEFIAQHLSTLTPLRRFFGATRREGGRVEYYLSCTSEGAVGVVFEPDLLVALGRMHIRVGIDGFASF